MLNLVLGKDWVANRDYILRRISDDIAQGLGRRILIVPELISHDMERRLCACAGNTSSRFCEVLSFSRLADRVAESAGRHSGDCLDNGGRIVAMAAAVRQMHSKLKAYASLETRPEFLTSLVDAVDEFKCCCISPKDLMLASNNTQGNLAQKLEEIAYIYEAYDALCRLGKKDPRDIITWMLEELEDDTFAQDHTFYIDGFPDFTRQHMNVLEHFIQYAPNVVISLNCDRPGTERIAFEKAGKTAQEILNCAKAHNVDFDITVIDSNQTHLTAIKENLLERNKPVPDGGNHLQTFHTDTIYQECVVTAERIISAVHSGCRYRDIGVVCADLPAYKSVLQMVFRRCGIPVYLSGTDELLEKNIVSAILCAVEAALGGFEQRDVMQYLKSILSPLPIEVCDLIENYTFIWNINGNAWTKEWVNHPEGLKDQWTDADQIRLKTLNDAKDTALKPLVSFRDSFCAAQNMAQQTEALYGLFDNIGLSERFSSLADELDRAGDNRSAQILNQLWDILLNSLEQMHSVLGESIWDADTFTQLFKLLLSQYDVGTIPPVLDSVSIGPISSMRCQKTKHLFVLGALEGSLPSYGSATGVLSDLERKELRKLGVPVNDGSIVGLQAEFAEIYGVFCGASESITISHPSGQPSFIYQRLAEVSGEDMVVIGKFGPALTDKTEAAALVARFADEAVASDLAISDSFNEVVKKREHTLGTVSEKGITGLYGTSLRLSASQIDCQAQCRLFYFLNYGLRVREWRPAQIDPSEFGTYAHNVLENTVKKVMELGGFRNVSAEEISQIAKEFSQEYAKSHFSQIDSERLQHIFNKNVVELDMIVAELWQEMQVCDFQPVEFELAFGASDGKMPAIDIPNKRLNAKLGGYVDRVDVWDDGNEKYFRVVDYKTGKKNFDYCDVFNGIGLQMLLYMFALEQEGGSVLGDSRKPAGVMYFPARAPYVSVDNAPTDDEVQKQRNSGMKRRGLLLFNENVLRAMESEDRPKRLPISRTKDGKISGDLATEEQLDLLKKYVFAVLANMVEEITSGNVAPNPYLRGYEYGVCTYCPYGHICHRSSISDCRNYKAVSAQRFWEDVESEVKKGG